MLADRKRRIRLSGEDSSDVYTWTGWKDDYSDLKLSTFSSIMFKDLQQYLPIHSSITINGSPITKDDLSFMVFNFEDIPWVFLRIFGDGVKENDTIITQQMIDNWSNEVPMNSRVFITVIDIVSSSFGKEIQVEFTQGSNVVPFARFKGIL